MKKAFLVIAVAALAIACKKVPKGGNSGVLKMEEGVERYDSHENRSATHNAESAGATATHTDSLITDSVTTQPAPATPVSDSAAAQ